MTKKSDNLLGQCLEIEGLLALISKREDNTPAMVFEMLRAKTEELQRAAAELCDSAGGEAVIQEPDEDESEELDAIGRSAVIEEEEDADVMPDGCFSDEEDGIPAEMPVIETETEVEAEAVTADIEPVDEMEPVEMESVSVSEMEPVSEPQSDLKSEPVVSIPEAAMSPSVAPVEPAEPVVPESVDEPYESEMSVLSDRFAEFTLNDKFRFRRELFGNSDIDMNEAIDVVNAMSSKEEVEDYFYNDMCWDPSNEDVRDFIRIVTAKF